MVEIFVYLRFLEEFFKADMTAFYTFKKLRLRRGCNLVKITQVVGSKTKI